MAMDRRNNILDVYAAGMADIWLSRNQTASDVVIIYNKIIRDQYQDAIHKEVARVKKKAIVKKDPSMNYVQELLGEVLLEDNLNQIPWIVSVTMTGLPRAPRMDDQIIIDDIKYTISMVLPKNRFLRSMLSMFIYPERVDDSIEPVENNSDFNDDFNDDFGSGLVG